MPTPRPRWLQLMYAVLIVSSLAFAVLILGDVIAAFESVEHDEHGVHDAKIFDLAWPVFVLSFLVTLSAGIAALIAGKLRRNAPSIRYSVWALGFCALAAVVVVVTELT